MYTVIVECHTCTLTRYSSSSVASGFPLSSAAALALLLLPPVPPAAGAELFEEDLCLWPPPACGGEGAGISSRMGAACISLRASLASGLRCPANSQSSFQVRSSKGRPLRLIRNPGKV